MSRNMTIQELLIPETFIKAVQRLSESPEHLKFFEEHGISKYEVMNNNIGLAEDWRMYTPILASDDAIGAFFIMPSLEMGTYELMDDLVGLVGNVKDMKSRTVVIVDTIAEMILMRRTYSNVVLFPQRLVYKGLFKRFAEIIFLHYDPELMLNFPNQCKCCYLTDYYRGEELPMAQFVSAEDKGLVKDNPFMLDGKLHFFLWGNTFQVINSTESYKVVMKGKNHYECQTKNGKLYILTDPITLPFSREPKIETIDLHTKLTDWLMDRLVYLTRYEIDFLAYYFMYTWVFPHFDLQLNLNLVFTSKSVARWSYKPMEYLLPGIRFTSYIPAVYTVHDTGEIPYLSVPHLVVNHPSNISSYENMPILYIDNIEPIRKFVLEGHGYLRNLMINWALDWEMTRPKNIKKRLTPLSTILAYLVWRGDDLGIYQSHLDKSMEKMRQVQKGKIDIRPLHD